MSKKNFLELLIKSFGLTPQNVTYYKTESNGGEYQSATGWKGEGVDATETCVIVFHEPDGFNMAVHEILFQANRKGLKPKYVNP